jgi:DUF438 domain-containing protein
MRIFTTFVKNKKYMTDFFRYQEVSITICDKNAMILYMNAKAIETFSDQTGKSLFACHPPHAAEKIKKMLADGIPNAYTIAKKGRKKMIYQTAWHDQEGNIGGLIEYSFPVAEELPHYIRS